MNMNTTGSLRFEIINHNKVFFSYQTIVAVQIATKLYLTNKRYSVTTSKHLSIIKCNTNYIKCFKVNPKCLEKLARV
jgi:hypothetical protein